MKEGSDTRWPDDEVLVAFADGQLDAEQSAKVIAFLETDRDAKRFVEALKRSGEMARVAYDEALPVRSDKLAEMILGSEGSAGPLTQATPPVSSNVVPIFSKRKPSGPFGGYALPLAASIALMIGAFTGYQIGKGGDPGSTAAPFDIAVGPTPEGGPVHRILESQSSGDPVAVSHGPASKAGELMIVATFRDQAGRVCRELEVTHPGEEGSAITGAVACRKADGGWFVEGAARLAAAPPVPDKDYSPAGGNEISAIEGVLKSIGAKPALTASDEKVLIKRGWK